MRPTPSECPVCGAYSLAPEAPSAALLAVADVLVVKTLETIGKRIVRASRSRYHEHGAAPWHTAHTRWTMDDAGVAKALTGAWDVLPVMLAAHARDLDDAAGCAADVRAMLDEYVRDLVITGHPHTLDALCYRFVTRLGLPVWTRDSAHAPA